MNAGRMCSLLCVAVIWLMGCVHRENALTTAKGTTGGASTRDTNSALEKEDNASKMQGHVVMSVPELAFCTKRVNEARLDFDWRLDRAHERIVIENVRLLANQTASPSWSSEIQTEDVWGGNKAVCRGFQYDVMIAPERFTLHKGSEVTAGYRVRVRPRMKWEEVQGKSVEKVSISNSELIYLYPFQEMDVYRDAGDFVIAEPEQGVTVP